MKIFRKNSIRTTLMLITILGVFLPISILIIIFGIQNSDYSIEISKSNAALQAIEYIRSIENKLSSENQDLTENLIQKHLSTLNISDNSAEIIIFSKNGQIYANNINPSNVGKKLQDILPSYQDESSHVFSNQTNTIAVNDAIITYGQIQNRKSQDAMFVRVAIPESIVKGESSNAFWIRVVFAILIGLISIAITYYYFNSITVRVTKLAAAAKRMARGNLFIDFETVGNDEITDLGKSLQSIITRFADIVKGLKGTMEQLHESGNILSKTAQKLSEGASEQASSTQEVTASMEQMNANIEQNAENAKQADLIAQESSKKLVESSESVKSTSNSMGDIAKKTSIIGDIAFQVNILALNAAVEAARAGAQGKGFGVVANEVGKLADRSKIAAEEIDELTNSSLIVAKKSGQSLEELVPEIQKTTALVQEITNASVEQKSGAQQINNAIQQLNGVTQQNALSAEQLATNVDSLTALANKLNKFIAFFKLESRKERRIKSSKENIANKKNVNETTSSLTKTSVKKEEPVKKDVKKTKETLKKSKGIDLNLGDEHISDDGFERF